MKYLVDIFFTKCVTSIKRNGVKVQLFRTYYTHDDVAMAHNV